MRIRGDHVSPLKCLNCGSIFEKTALTTYGGTGASGSSLGVGKTLVVWPLTLRVFAECPVCKQKGWIKALSPWSKK